jgi:hypothetical protein
MPYRVNVWMSLLYLKKFTKIFFPIQTLESCKRYYSTKADLVTLAFVFVQVCHAFNELLF